MYRLAPGIRLLTPYLPQWNSKSGRAYVFAWTFIIYTCYHISRKPISVVKSVLHQNCTEIAEKTGHRIVPENATFCDWKPFDGDNYDSLFGTLDLVFLLAYTVGMFISGHAADHFHLRHYLSVGAISCGLATMGFGIGFFLNVHSYAYYIVVQIIAGLFQSTGWPAVVSSMGNWFGKSKRGFFMGVWNAHTSVGNILGSVIAGAFVSDAWGWSFVVPGLMIMTIGIISYFFLLPYPEELGIPPPDHRHKDSFNFTIQTDENPPRTEEVRVETVASQSSLIGPEQEHSISILTALRVPGVVEYSLCLLFSKLVSYTFLFWLPSYIRSAGNFDPENSADLSAIFDVGGIIGGILAGAIADKTRSSAVVCVVMLICSVPMMYIYLIFGSVSVTNCIAILLFLGLFVNGPYALITTAVSADLGTHPSLSSNSRALATVTGIIDGTGSIGAALGPLFCGLLKPYGWGAVFSMLIVSLILAALLLSRRVIGEIRTYIRTRSFNLIVPASL